MGAHGHHSQALIADRLASVGRADMADWVTAAAYLVAALLTVRAARQAALRSEASERRFWRISTVLLVLLGINELLDLQTLLTAVGRADAEANGWYGHHRRVQYIFVMALAGAAAIAGLALLWLTKRSHAAVRLALVGLVFIGLFVLLRAASFHHLDDLLGRGWAPFNWGSLQEMAGILVVAGAALFYVRKRGGKSES